MCRPMSTESSVMHCLLMNSLWSTFENEVIEARRRRSRNRTIGSGCGETIKRNVSMSAELYQSFSRRCYPIADVYLCSSLDRNEQTKKKKDRDNQARRWTLTLTITECA